LLEFFFSKTANIPQSSARITHYVTINAQSSVINTQSLSKTPHSISHTPHNLANNTQFASRSTQLATNNRQSLVLQSKKSVIHCQ